MNVITFEHYQESQGLDGTETHVGLLHDGDLLVGVLKVFKGDIQAPDKYLISLIEIHPEFRRRGLARSLHEKMTAQLGATIYSTTRCSQSGAALINALGIPKAYGETLEIKDFENYQLIDWD